MSEPQTSAGGAARVVSLSELFVGFLLIGLLGFGGIAPSAHYVIVERNRWLDQKEFVELFGVCSILPGGNFLNATVILGDRYQGVLGSLVGLRPFCSPRSRSFWRCSPPIRPTNTCPTFRPRSQAPPPPPPA